MARVEEELLNMEEVREQVNLVKRLLRAGLTASREFVIIKENHSPWEPSRWRGSPLGQRPRASIQFTGFRFLFGTVFSVMYQVTGAPDRLEDLRWLGKTS